MEQSTKQNLKELALKVENLARDLQLKVENDDDYLTAASDLTKSQMTLVFALGEVYGANKVVKTAAKVVKSGNYHNLRDKSGRFCKK